MATIGSTHIVGYDYLDDMLRGFEPRLRAGIKRKAARAAAKPVLNAARAKAPKLTKTLSKSIKIKQLKRKRGKFQEGVQIKTMPEVFLRLGPMNPHWYEFGAKGHLAFGKGPAPLQPRPFMRPAMDENRAKVKEIFEVELNALVAQIARQRPSTTVPSDTGGDTADGNE